MRPKYAFEFPADTLQRCAGASVSRIRVKADAKHTPDVEGVLQHQQLRFSIDAGANRGPCQPCVADLAGVRRGPAMRGMAWRPRPPFDVPETCRSDNGSIARTDDRKRNCGASILPSERGLHVFTRLRLSLRHGTPAIQSHIFGGGRHNSIDVTVAQWFETNLLPLQCDRVLRHSSNMQFRQA